MSSDNPSVFDVDDYGPLRLNRIISIPVMFLCYALIKLLLGWGRLLYFDLSGSIAPIPSMPGYDLPIDYPDPVDGLSIILTYLLVRLFAIRRYGLTTGFAIGWFYVGRRKSGEGDEYWHDRPRCRNDVMPTPYYLTA